MKNALLNPRVLRNTCSIVCASVAMFILFWAAKGFFVEFLTPEKTHMSMYEVLKTSLLYNVIGGLFVSFAILSYAGSVSRKIDLCAVCGILGALSFIGYGCFILFYGFAAGKILASLGIFVLTSYAEVGLMIGARVYNCHLWAKTAKKENKTIEQLPEYNAHFMEPAI